MTAIARNHPCPCGSGKKYKLCCLGRQETAAREAHQARLRERLAARRVELVLDDDPLTLLSNQANTLIREARLDDAERVCQQLLDEYPDYVDGHERSAQLHEARGDHKAAALAWREALALALTQDGFEPESYDWMRDQIKRLDP
jgi:hypothetical protein